MWGKFNIQFLKYIVAGVINTGVGYGVFLILHRLFGVSPEGANASGYAIALVVAFLLNKVFVFDKSVIDGGTIPRFIAAFIVAYVVNLLILMIFYRMIGLVAEAAQVFAMISYTVIFYYLNKHFVFNDQIAQDR